MMPSFAATPEVSVTFIGPDGKGFTVMVCVTVEKQLFAGLVTVTV